MDGNHFSDMVGLRIGEWVVCMNCVTTYLFHDAKESELVGEKDIQGNRPHYILCGRKIGITGQGRGMS